MTNQRTCDGVLRRDFLRVGAAGALTLPTFLRWSQAGEAGRTGRANAAIFINLGGGPSHMDTFDLKPNAPSEFRGEFNPIETNVPGLMISEHLPLLARTADKFALLRGVSHTLAAHELGSEYVNTGNRPLASLNFPSYGSVVTKELGGPSDLPSFVGVPKSTQRPGYLGVRYAAMSTGATPKAGQSFAVRGMTLAKGLTVTDVERRQALLADLDRTFDAAERESSLLDGMDRFTEQARELILSPKSRHAFDTGQESPAFAKPFGESSFGQSCLLASRLVESGVRFVTVSMGGWDTHNDNWTALKKKQLPPFDEGLSALLNGLAEKGLLETTTVFVTGEFGRTPKINATRNGRDHYPRNMFMLLAGGGVKGGQVLGESDEKGQAPVGTGFKPDDVAASFYQTLGIDPKKEYHTNTGRPVMIVRDGEPISQLFG